MKKTMTIAVILLITMPIINIGIANSHNTTIYVDDDNTEGPWDGSFEYPYQYIHDGIEAANENNVIFVFNGMYYTDTIIIDKPITIEGENVRFTIITPNSNSQDVFFKIKCSNVNIKKFTFNQPQLHGDGIKIKNANYCRIEGNIFKNTHPYREANACAIEIDGNNNVISKNEFDGFYYCIDIANSRKNTIRNNNILNTTNIFPIIQWYEILKLGPLFNFFVGNDFKNNYYDNRNLRGVIIYMIQFFLDFEDPSVDNLIEGAKILPYPIKKTLIFRYPDPFPMPLFMGLPVFDFDWYPAREPFDITI